VYRFLATPRWAGFLLLMVAMSVVMVGLSDWQYHRYHFRHGINVRIEQAKKTAPVPMASVMSLDHPVTDAHEWTRVTVTGTYLAAKTVVARERTVNDDVGFEIITPMQLSDGTIVMIDRGFLPGGSALMPKVPAATPGTVTVIGRVHAPESEPDRPTVVEGQLTFRRVTPDSVRSELGGARLYPDYILLDDQSPAQTTHFTKIPADTQPAWMNAGYTIQWAGFALIPIFGFAWQARKEAQTRRNAGTPTTPPVPRSRDRVPDDLPVPAPAASATPAGSASETG